MSKNEKKIVHIRKKLNGNMIFIFVFILFVITLMYMLKNFIPEDNIVNSIIDDIKIENREKVNSRNYDISMDTLDEITKYIQSNILFVNTNGEFSDQQIETVIGYLMDEIYPKYSKNISQLEYEILILRIFEYSNNFEDINGFINNATNYININFTYGSLNNVVNKNNGEQALLNYSERIITNKISDDEIRYICRIIHKNNENVSSDDINKMISEISSNPNVLDDTLEKIIYIFKNEFPDLSIVNLNDVRGYNDDLNYHDNVYYDEQNNQIIIEKDGID